MSHQPAISIVIPVYNEHESVDPLYAKVKDACRHLKCNYEIVFIDDGSQDETFASLQRLHTADSTVKIIRFRKNFGQTAAMVAGFAFARGETIVSMDGDLQNDPADIPRLLAEIENGSDVVCGWRRQRQDKFWSRRFPSIIANRIISYVTGVRIHDNGCSLKAYRASVIKSVALYGEMHRFIPAMTTLAGARITEIVVHHHPRRFGQSKYGLGRVWRVALDIITVKLITGFGSRPALWFGLLCVPVSIVGLGQLLFATAYFAGENEWMVMSTVAFLLFVLCVHFVTLGFVGELALKTGNYRSRATLAPTITSE